MPPALPAAQTFLAVNAFRASADYVVRLSAANQPSRETVSREEIAALFSRELYGTVS